MKRYVAQHASEYLIHYEGEDLHALINDRSRVVAAILLACETPVELQSR